MKHLTIILLLLSTQLHAQYEWIEKKDYTNLPSLTLTPKEVVYHYIIIEEWKQGKKDIDSLAGKCRVMSARITQMGRENNSAFKALQTVTVDRDSLADKNATLTGQLANYQCDDRHKKWYNNKWYYLAVGAVAGGYLMSR
jgi:hypothetical protein